MFSIAATKCSGTVYTIETDKSPKIITSTVDNDIFEIIRFRKIVRHLPRKSQFPEGKDADKYS